MCRSRASPQVTTGCQVRRSPLTGRFRGESILAATHAQDVATFTSLIASLSSTEPPSRRRVKNLTKPF